jgi:hypothetical protein
MRYQVPQFIETETKLVGPFTLRQFLWVAAGVCFLVLESLFLTGAVRLGAAFITVAFFGALAYIRIDGQPLINYLAYVLSFALGSKEYLFRRSEPKNEINLPGMPGV